MAILMCYRTSSSHYKLHHLGRIFHSHKVHQKVLLYLYQHLTSSQVSVALRPFYFLVHPDLFARYPRAQHVNDANLKALKNHLDSLVNKTKKLPLDLQFYVKPSITEDPLELKSLNLKSNSAKSAVQKILSSFDLPTNYVDNLQEKNESTTDQEKNPKYYYHNTYNQYGDIPEVKDNLYSWLLKNMGKAEKRLMDSKPIRKDIWKLKTELVNQLNIEGVSWERGIGTTHLRGCLQGLKALVTHHPDTKHVLQGRKIHFGNETGLSLEGIVVLSTSEVRDQWHRMMSRIPSTHKDIRKIRPMQKAVSISLRDIQVTHRKYQPFLLVEAYSQHLRRLVTALGDFLGKSGFPKDWPSSLTHLQLVVESASGPLMLSPTGQILAPSSCPPWLLVNFISENMIEASKRIEAYESKKNMEKELHSLCLKELNLSFLDKDDSVHPELMVTCLENLLANSYRLAPLLSGARLWITQYYSVMLDGEICVPWDWN